MSGETVPDDAEHLKLLSIFHYVVGGFHALGSCFPILHLAVGLMMVLNPDKFTSSGHNPTPPEMGLIMGWFFIVIASGIMLCGWTLSGFTLYAGRCLARRKRYLLCLVVAGLNCMLFPFGTALGVFTLLVLQRPSVKALFHEAT